MPPARNKSADPVARDRARVLVIDDDPLFRSLLVSLLRRDYLVSVASNGSEGFHKALEHVPDIAIIDIQMPGWDGLKTLKAFRSHPVLSRVCAMVLTSDASRETVLAAIHAGANDYLIKTSFSRDDFQLKLERLRSRLPSCVTLARSDARPSAVAAASPPVRDEVRETPEPPAAELAPAATASAGPGLQEVLDSWE